MESINNATFKKILNRPLVKLLVSRTGSIQGYADGFRFGKLRFIRQLNQKTLRWWAFKSPQV